jgi:predicted small secreted protein
MNTGKLILAIGLAVIAAALLTASVLAFMDAQGTYSPYGATSNGASSGGMMGGAYSAPQSPAQPNQATPTYPYQYGSGGCRGRGTSYVAPTPNTETTEAPLTIETAEAIAQQYVTQLNSPDLAVREVEEYTQNFYVQIYEKSTGIGAFELLIDKYTGSVLPEQGPNMMWNTKYRMHSGIMGWFPEPTSPIMVTAEQAETLAQQYLDTHIPGTTVGETEAFYGYYHLMVLSAGESYGMPSVNGYTGQLWYHNWHGAFIQELETS